MKFKIKNELLLLCFGLSLASISACAKTDGPAFKTIGAIDRSDFGLRRGGDFGSRLRNHFDMIVKPKAEAESQSRLISTADTENRIFGFKNLAQGPSNLKIGKDPLSFRSAPEGAGGLSKFFSSHDEPGHSLQGGQDLSPEQKSSRVLRQVFDDHHPKRTQAASNALMEGTRVSVTDGSEGDLSNSNTVSGDKKEEDDRQLGNCPEEQKLQFELQQYAQQIEAIQVAEEQYQSAIAVLQQYEKEYQARLEFYKNQEEKYATEEHNILEEHQVLEKQNADLSAQIAQLKAANEQLLASIQGLEDVHEKTNLEYNELVKKSVILDNEDRAIRFEIASVQQEDAHYKQQYEDLTKQFSDLESEKQHLESDKEAIEKSKDVIQKQLSTLKEQLNREKQNKDAIISRNQELQAQEQGAESDIQKYTNALVSLVNDIALIEKFKRATTQNQEKLQKDEQDLSVASKKLTDQSECLNKREAELDEKERQLDKQEEECKCTQDQLAMLMSEKSAAEANQKAMNSMMTSMGNGSTLQNPMMFYNSVISSRIPGDFYPNAFGPMPSDVQIGDSTLEGKDLSFGALARSPLANNRMNQPSALSPVASPPQLNVFNDPYFSSKGFFKNKR